MAYRCSALRRRQQGCRCSILALILRPNAPRDDDPGMHVALRAKDRDAVDAFHAAALAHGGMSDGAPGLRGEPGEGYYAVFIRDPDGNRIEAVTFLK